MLALFRMNDNSLRYIHAIWDWDVNAREFTKVTQYQIRHTIYPNMPFTVSVTKVRSAGTYQEFV